jgi:hypothetical protein
MKNNLLIGLAVLTCLTTATYGLVSTGSLATITDVVCPDEGREKAGSKPLSAEKKEFNKRKNKSAAEPTEKPTALSYAQWLNGREKVDDKGNWKEGTYVELKDVYLIDYKEQKGESCNCYQADSDKTKADIHLNIGDSLSFADKINDYYMVIEITPSYKALHKNVMDSLKLLKNQKVTIRGYLFYDSEHERNSINYCKTCISKNVWRKSCWEIHPITYIGKSK